MKPPISFKSISLFLALVFSSSTCLYPLDVYLKLTSKGEKINIGLINFNSIAANTVGTELARKIQDVLKTDLLFSRYFNVTSMNAVFTGKKEEFDYFRNQFTDVILTGSLSSDKSGRALNIKLFNVESGELMFEKVFQDSGGDYRSLAHSANDEIILRFTGQKGMAHTKIVFVNDSTGSKEICKIDYDGYNLKRLTEDNSINLFPKWSPDGGKVAFTTYKYGNPDLYIMNSNGSNRKAVSTYQGLNISPTWSNDGNSMALTVSKGKSPNIYIENLNGQILKRLTHSNGIDSSPCFSPNNREIAFISDRAGIPQLYICDNEGANVRRVITEGYSDSPSWSPKGDKIAFAMRFGGESFFNIYLYDIASDKAVSLTGGQGSNESPSFSPDGRFIVFSSTRNGKKELFIICVDGSGEHRLADIKKNSQMPHWSP
ncbi:MAG: Tol-Pal system beta propeller repeat protein TolB [Elusimicrobia bacterium RIFOXYA2_FULL_40_6]|nr:MAG: Tol-Pal system beta propeller repeat protein TolB [Elusimicrobia bacterium RIFOXYA2_FULL_40_6]